MTKVKKLGYEADREASRKRVLQERCIRLAAGSPGGKTGVPAGIMADAMMDGEVLWRAGELLADRLADVAYDAIGSVGTPSVPVAVTTTVEVFSRGYLPVSGFRIVRNSGESWDQARIVGGIKQGSKVVLIASEFTDGLEALQGVKVLNRLGVEVVLVLALVDRNRGAAAMLDSYGIRYEVVFGIDDFKLGRGGHGEQ